MTFKTWVKDAKGNVITLPLASYETAISLPSAIAVRLRMLHPGDAPDRPSGSVQLVLSPAQASALGEALIRSAVRVLEQPANGPS